jgi:hypothetical protein
MGNMAKDGIGSHLKYLQRTLASAFFCNYGQRSLPWSIALPMLD